MNITDKFVTFALLGAEWVMWLLILLSVVSVAIMIDRWRYFARRRVDLDQLQKDLRESLAENDPERIEKKYGALDAIEVTVGLAGLRESQRGAEATAEAMIGAKSRKRPEMERNIAFLGTVGNNAPFIGLFGTVLGVIRAFHDLAQNESAGASTVMAGISEALVATAVGLMVAIPAVMTFNYFQRRVRYAVASADTVAHALLAELRGEASTRDRGAA